MGSSKAKRFAQPNSKRFAFGQTPMNTTFSSKSKRAIGFLQNKHKVQVTILFRGRENAHIEEGKSMMQSIVAQLEEYGKVTSMPSQQGRRLVCTIEPK